MELEPIRSGETKSTEFRSPMTTAIRTFKDAAQVKWEVWDVVPQNAERRFQGATPDDLGEERRERVQFRVNLGKHMAEGWLIFESSTERRRLAPIPEKWAALTEPELAQLCLGASRVERPRLRTSDPFGRKP